MQLAVAQSVRRLGECCGLPGVQDAADVVSYLLAGADVVMTTSALLRQGPQHADVLLDGVTEWMQRKGFDSVDQLRGLLAAPAGADHSAQERSSYVSAMRRANTGLYGSW